MKKILLLLFMLPALMQAQLPSYSNPFTVTVCPTSDVDLGVNSSTTNDGYTVSSGTPITGLLMFESNPADNGIYQTNAGTSAWTRISAADTWTELMSAAVTVTNGDLYGATTISPSGTAWFMSGNPGGTVGTTAIPFVPAALPMQGLQDGFWSVATIVADGSQSSWMVKHLHGPLLYEVTAINDQGGDAGSYQPLGRIAGGGIAITFDVPPGESSQDGKILLLFHGPLED